MLTMVLFELPGKLLDEGIKILILFEGIEVQKAL